MRVWNWVFGGLGIGEGDMSPRFGMREGEEAKEKEKESVVGQLLVLVEAAAEVWAIYCQINKAENTYVPLKENTRTSEYMKNIYTQVKCSLPKKYTCCMYRVNNHTCYVFIFSCKFGQTLFFAHVGANPKITQVHPSEYKTRKSTEH